jgi:hypothetical protein
MVSFRVPLFTGMAGRDLFRSTLQGLCIFYIPNDYYSAAAMLVFRYAGIR